jgi:hypothetical protein
MRFTIEDTDGELFPVMINCLVYNDTTMAQLVSAVLMPTWAVIMPLITGILVDASLVFSPSLIDFEFPNNVVDMLSDIQEKAKFVFSMSEARDSLSRVTLPTVREVIFTGSGAGKKVDITDTDVAAFIAWMQSGITEFRMTDSHDIQVDGFVEAFQWFGKG